MEIIVIIVAMIAMMWGLNYMNRKQQKKQQENRDAAVVVGNDVVTTAGFLGRIVDIDGDAVTLESPSGEESVWLRGAIAGKMSIPVAGISEEEAAAQDEAEISGANAGNGEDSAEDAAQTEEEK